MTVKELIEKRAKAWEAAKDFVKRRMRRSNSRVCTVV